LEPVESGSWVGLVATPAGEVPDLPVVRVSYFEQVPYVQVVEGGRVVLDLSCAAALNLALLLVAEAGQGLNGQLARALPQSWPSR
jgi:hypothetical protein